MVVAQLIFEMAANVARLQSDMQKANATVTSAMQGIRGAADMAKKGLAAVGVALGVREFADMIKGSAEALDHLRSLSIQTGITVETLSALKGVARESGTDLDYVANTVNRLEKNMLSAVNGNAKMAKAFEDIGVSREQVQAGLNDMDSFLPMFAQHLVAAAEGGQLSAEAQVFMGRSAAKTIEFMEALAAVQKLQSKTTTEQTEQAHQFIVALRDMEARSASLKREFTVGLLPALNSIMGAFSDSAVGAGEARGAGEAFGQVMRWTAQTVYGAWSALDLFGKTLAMISAAMYELGRGNVRLAINVVKEGMDDIRASAARAGEAIGKMGEEAKKLPDVRRKQGSGTRGPVAAPTSDTDSTDYAGEFADGGTIGAGEWGVVGEAGPEIVSGGSSGVSVTPMIAGAKNVLGTVAAQAKALNQELRQAKVLGKDMGEILDQAGLKSVKRLSDLEGVLKNVAMQLVKMAASGLFDKGVAGVKDFIGPAAAGAGGTLPGDFAGMFADGGTIPAGMWGVVGEQGPEIAYGGSGGATISPALAGGDTHNYYIDARGADAGAVARLQSLFNRLDGSIEFRALAATRRGAALRGRAISF